MSPRLADRPQSQYAVNLAQSKKYARFIKLKRAKLRKNSIVRVAYERNKFSRGYFPRFDSRLYRITGINENLPQVMYSLATAEDNIPLKGHFYPEEIASVLQDQYFPIERIIKTYPRRQLALVSWLGYDDSFNSLVPLSDVKSYSDLWKEAKQEQPPAV